MTKSVYPPTGKSSGCPLTVAYGLGVDSTAMLVGMHQRGIRPDLILFADTGGEKPETYAYLSVMQAWLKKVGFPQVQVVKYVLQGAGKYGHYSTLEEQCLTQGDLPGFAHGHKSCSTKWKRGPQDKFVAKWKPAQDCWARGGLVVKAIGYDAGPADSQRATNLADPTVGYTAVDSAGKKHTGAAQTLEDVHERVADAGWKLVSTKQLPIRYQYWYPLRDWGWDRDECKKQIKKAGLPLPMKSSCFFCPAMKAQEVEELVRLHPELAMRSVRMEEVFRSPHGKFRPEGNINKQGKRVPGTQGLWRGSQMGPFIRHHLSQLVPGYQLVRKKK